MPSKKDLQERISQLEKEVQKKTLKNADHMQKISSPGKLKAAEGDVAEARKLHAKAVASGVLAEESEKKVAELEAKLTEVKEKYDELEVKAKKDTHEHEMKIADLSASLQSMTEEAERAKNEMQELRNAPPPAPPTESEIDQMRKRVAEAEAETERAKAELKELTDRWDAKVAEIEELNNTRALNKRIKSAEDAAYKSSEDLVKQGEKLQAL